MLLFSKGNTLMSSALKQNESISNEKKWEPADAEIIFAIIYHYCYLYVKSIVMTFILMLPFYPHNLSLLELSSLCLLHQPPQHFFWAKLTVTQRQLNGALQGTLNAIFSPCLPLTQSKHKQIHHLPISSLPYLLFTFIESVK